MMFKQVRIDPEVHTLVWPNGADFNPATLHDWPADEQTLKELTQRRDELAFDTKGGAVSGPLFYDWVLEAFRSLPRFSFLEF